MLIPSPWVFSSPKRDCSHGTFTVLCSVWVGNPREKGRWDWVPARGGTRPPLLPITATYLEKVILGLQHLPGQVSNAEESHIRGAVDNGQVNQPAAGTEMEKKNEKSVPCDPSVPSEHRRVPSLAPSRRLASSPGRCSGEPEGWLWPLGGRLGAGWLPGEFQLPAAGRAGRHFCFPPCTGVVSKSQAGTQQRSKSTGVAQSPRQPLRQPTLISFSPFHILPPWQCWRWAEGHQSSPQSLVAGRELLSPTPMAV